MKPTRILSFSRRAVVLLSGLLLAGQPLPTRAQSGPAAGAVPVVLPRRSNVAGLFVASGHYVHRGQVLAKLEQPNGEVYYVSAPASGRVTFAALPIERPLPAHTVLATVTVVAKSTP
jgi:Na+-translocating ferredoxin:NAD+ oxidoreductase RnfC subunit